MKSELEEKTLTIGEKLSIRRFEKLTGDCVASYIHGGGRIGVLVAAVGASGDAVKEALTNIAMQIAAMNPEYISRNDMSADELAKLREIIVDSALNDPATLPKPILNKLIEKAISEKSGVMLISQLMKNIRATCSIYSISLQRKLQLS